MSWEPHRLTEWEAFNKHVLLNVWISPHCSLIMSVATCITCGLPLDCGLKLEVHTELGTRAHWKFKALLLWVFLHEDQDFHHVTTEYHLVTRLPITQAVSANQNIANKVVCEKPKAWSQKLRHNNGMNKGWWIPNRTFTISNDACLLMMSDDIWAAVTHDKLFSFKSWDQTQMSAVCLWTQYCMGVRSKACLKVTRGLGWELFRESFIVYS